MSSEITARGIQVEIETDAGESARRVKQLDRHERNSQWLADHWSELLPLARGKFVAVAEQNSFVANTAVEAWDWARQVHPNDDGAIVRYIRPDTRPRFYGNRRTVD